MCKRPHSALNLDKESDECVKWWQTWSSLIFLLFFDMYNHSGAGVAAQAVVALPLVEPVSRPPGFQLM